MGNTTEATALLQQFIKNRMTGRTVGTGHKAQTLGTTVLYPFSSMFQGCAVRVNIVLSLEKEC